jgi:UDP-N-acetylmuramate dehydrogenase
MLYLDQLTKSFKGEIRLNELLAPYTSLKLGGPADVFLMPKDKQDVIEAVKWIKQYNLNYYVLGFGTNLLVSDAGFRGVVIHLSNSLDKIEIAQNSVYAEAGVSLPLLVLETLKHGLGGMEMLGGVPGTLGGAVIMNAGAYGGEIFDVIKKVEIVRGTDFQILAKKEIHFEYRKTNLDKDIVIAAHFELKPGNKEELLDKRKEMLKKRRDSQPLELPNAGSIFKNPQGHFAGVLIEKCGLKGYRVGGVSVSEKHANFLVNDQNGTSSDMMILIDHVKKTVREQCSVELEMEVKKLGFDS